MPDHMDRRDFVTMTAAAGAGLSLGGLAGCGTGDAPTPRVLASAADLSDAAIADFEAALNGQLIGRGHAEYEAARMIQNARFDQRPGLIVRCANQSDVATAVDFAQAENLLVAVRCGGHSSAGYGSCNDGLVLDVTRMKGIEVDADALTVRVDAGLLSMEIDTTTAQHGLATILPDCPSVGIGGFALGGGGGKLGGVHGMSCDNLLSAEVVLADGSTVTASADSHPELFWGLRGGGGNFGVVTSFEFRLYPVSTVLAGAVMYDVSQVRDVLEFYSEFAESEPDELYSALLKMQTPQGPMLMITVNYLGDSQTGESVLAPLRSFGTPMMTQIGEMPYVQAQAMGPPSMPGRAAFSRGGFLPQMHTDVVDAVVASSQEPLFTAFWHHHGAPTRVAPGDTPYPLREAGFAFQTASEWDAADPSQEEGATSSVMDVWGAVEPHTSGVAVNSLDIEGDARIREAYLGNYDRLVSVKNQYDPENFFRVNQNIKPTA
jgi:FAD/FMN-containing dehydrogenase